jgi:hypothetical protein
MDCPSQLCDRCTWRIVGDEIGDFLIELSDPIGLGPFDRQEGQRVGREPIRDGVRVREIVRIFGRVQLLVDLFGVFELVQIV